MGEPMVREILDEIYAKNNVRQNLSLLRQSIKNEQEKYALKYQLTGKEESMIALLEDEDAKTRKNVALLMGDLGQTVYLEPLMKAYQSETQLFVRNSYLTAIGQMDYRKFVEEFKNQLNLLNQIELTEENKKHITTEKKTLQDLILTMEGVKKHSFTRLKNAEQMVLLTNRNHVDTVLKQLDGIPVKAFNAGVIVKTRDLKPLLELRTYKELLFMIQGLETCVMDIRGIAEKVTRSSLLSFLLETHKGSAPFYFRIEIKSKMELSKRSNFAKKLAAEIEQQSKGQLLNTTSYYEIELRFIENKEGNFNVLVKLFTIMDRRFDYRIETLPTSIKPVNAALIMELARPYMKEEAQILDPFCGTGTMLIERHKAVKANTTYGIDYFGEAIEKAKSNTAAAHQLIHYIQRDFFDITHEYLFDEIITQMPWAIGRVTESEISELYRHFFEKAKMHLKEDGIIIMYSHNKSCVESFSRLAGWKILKRFEFSAKEGTYVYVMSLK